MPWRQTPSGPGSAASCSLWTQTCGVSAQTTAWRHRQVAYAASQAGSRPKLGTPAEAAAVSVRAAAGMAQQRPRRGSESHQLSRPAQARLASCASRRAAEPQSRRAAAATRRFETCVAQGTPRSGRAPALDDGALVLRAARPGQPACSGPRASRWLFAVVASACGLRRWSLQVVDLQVRGTCERQQQDRAHSACTPASSARAPVARACAAARRQLAPSRSQGRTAASGCVASSASPRLAAGRCAASSASCCRGPPPG